VLETDRGEIDGLLPLSAGGLSCFRGCAQFPRFLGKFSSSDEASLKQPVAFDR
jgi:hypothetical protein